MASETDGKLVWKDTRSAKAAFRKRGQYVEIQRRLDEMARENQSKTGDWRAPSTFWPEVLEEYPPEPGEDGAVELDDSGFEHAVDDDSRRVDPSIWDSRGGCTLRQAVQWVSEHLLCDGLEPEDAPSMLAWRLWCDYRGRKADRHAFDKEFATKLLPRGRELERLEREQSDGRDTLAALDRFEAALD